MNNSTNVKECISRIFYWIKELSRRDIECEDIPCGFQEVRCQCAYCHFCKNSASIYDECEGCYFGKHPHLPKIQNDFENYMKNTFPTGETPLF